MSAPALTRPTAPPAPGRTARRTARQRHRHGARARSRSSRSTCSWSCRSSPWPPSCPAVVGLGAVLARRRPGRRLLLPHPARRHRRLPPALHARLVQGRRGRCGSRWRSPARMADPGPGRAVGGRPPPAPRLLRPRRATRTRRGATAPTCARCSRACSTPTWAGCSTAARPTRSATRPTCSRTPPCVGTSRLFVVWAVAQLCPAGAHRRAGHRMSWAGAWSAFFWAGLVRIGAAAPRDLVDQLGLPRRRQPAVRLPRPGDQLLAAGDPQRRASRGTTCTTPTRPAPGTACCAARSTSAPG